MRTKLIAARKRLGLRQYEIARRTGMSRVSVGHWESGVRNPHIRRLRRVANAYGLSLDELLDALTDDDDG